MACRSRPTSRSIARSTSRSSSSPSTTVYRVTTLARSGLLWRVSRKLILSYILVGAVPILLLVTFATGGVSARVLRHQLVPRPRSRGAPHRAGQRVRPDDAVRNRAGGVVASTGTSSSAASRRSPAGIRACRSRWCRKRSCRSGCRAPDSPGSSNAERLRARCCFRAAADLRLRGLSSICRSTARWTKPRWRRPASRWASNAGRSLFNTATYVTYVDWETGAPAETHIAMGVDVPDAVHLDGGQPEGRSEPQLQPDSALHAGRASGCCCSSSRWWR